MSIFDDYEGILNIPENPRQQARQQAAQEIRERGQRVEQEVEERPFFAPGALILGTLQSGIGGQTRESMIKALERGGTPVRDERGMTWRCKKGCWSFWWR